MTSIKAVEGQLQGLSLRANFSWTFIGNIIYAASQWGILVILARLGTPEMVGQFALGITIAAPVITFAELNLRAVQATDARGLYQFGDYLGLRLIMLALAMVFLIVFTGISGYRVETALVIIAISTAKIFESVSDVFYGLLQHAERMDRIAKSMILKAILSVTLLTIGVYLTDSVLWGVAGLIIAWASLLFVYDVRSGHMTLQQTSAAISSLKPRWNRKTLLKLTWLALPLGFVLMLISLNASIPRYFIEQYLGEYELGIFVAIAYLERAGTTIASALGQSASPRMAKYYAAGQKKAYVGLVLKLLLVGSVIGVGGILVALIAGEEILMLLYGREYARQTLFVTLMIAIGINYVASFLGYAMTAARYFRVQLPLFGFLAILMIGLSALLIPSHGLQGAAICLLMISVVKAAGSLVVVIHAVKALPEKTKNYDGS